MNDTVQLDSASVTDRERGELASSWHGGFLGAERAARHDCVVDPALI